MSIFHYLDHIWYYHLVNQEGKTQKSKTGHPYKIRALLDEQSYYNKILICWTYDNKRLFGVFDNPIAFRDYENKIPPQERSFYEIILGDLSQKPHFDIDIKKQDHPDIRGPDVINNLITAIMKVLEGEHIQLDFEKDLLIYTSHGRGKLSFHVVINNHCHNSSREAHAFYCCVLDHLEKKYHPFIDSKVYSSIQQFRLLGSQKANSGRPKVFREKWKYNGKVFHHKYPTGLNHPQQKSLYQLECSFITLTGTCQYLPIFDHPLANKTKIQNPEDFTGTLLSTEDVSDIIEIFGRKMKYDLNDFPFEITQINDPFISLQRKCPTDCPICLRPHEHENPYLIIKNGDIYFDCRRAHPPKQMYIGTINKVQRFLDQWKENIEEHLQVPAIIKDTPKLLIHNIPPRPHTIAGLLDMTTK